MKCTVNELAKSARRALGALMSTFSYAGGMTFDVFEKFVWWSLAWTMVAVSGAYQNCRHSRPLKTKSNRILHNLLRMLPPARKRRCPKYIRELVFSYNVTPHSSTGYSRTFWCTVVIRTYPLVPYLKGVIAWKMWIWTDGLNYIGTK